MLAVVWAKGGRAAGDLRPQVRILPPLFSSSWRVSYTSAALLSYGRDYAVQVRDTL